MQQTYLIQAAAGGPLKIGVTGRAIVARLSDLQTGCPTRLRCVGVLAGNQEGVLHQRFNDERLHGEWFRASLYLWDWWRDAPGMERPATLIPDFQRQLRLHRSCKAKVWVQGRTFTKGRTYDVRWKVPGSTKLRSLCVGPDKIAADRVAAQIEGELSSQYVPMCNVEYASSLLEDDERRSERSPTCLTRQVSMSEKRQAISLLPT